MTAPPLPPIPVLRLDGPPPDAETLETWRESLSSVLTGEVPHSLLGLWYVGDEGVMLIGPAGLEADALPVPRPAPRYTDAELRRIEDVVRRAGYASVMALGLTHAGADSGLLLIADFPPGLYDESRMQYLRRTCESVAPLLARAVRMLAGHVEHEAPAPSVARLDLAAQAAMLDPALTPADMMARL